jgi:D-alanyl-lipoteichoic acid acyltransferase DltB (MBOAT superfamily)
MQRTGWLARLVAAGLLGVAIVWLAAPLPARLRDGVMLATSVGSVAFFLGLAPAAVALGFALVVYGVLEIRPAWIRRPLMVLLTVALLAVPLRWLFDFPTETGVVIRPYVAFAGAMAMLRLGRYARERRHADQRTPLMRYLLGVLFFPTFSTGPVQSVDELAAGGPAPATAAALARHLAQAGSGALRVTWGVAKIFFAVACLNLVTPEVLATAGAAVSRVRLWAWVVENTIYLWALFSGLSDVGTGLARMVGVAVSENFRAPWRAAHPAELWERVLATVTSSIDETVGGPIEHRFGAPAGVLARFAVAALWYAWIVLALLGVFGIPPSAWLGLAAWAGVFTAAWLVLPRNEARRPLGWTATHLLLAISTIPLIAFPRAHFQVFFGIAARLVGLR